MVRGAHPNGTAEIKGAEVRVNTGLHAPIRLKDWDRPQYITLTFAEFTAKAKRRQRWHQAGMAAGCFLACALAWVAVYVAVGGP